MKPASYQREQVVDIINSVLVRIKAPSGISHDALNGELTELKNIIESLRNDLHAARPGDISATHIPSATDELDAVVGTTEEATGTIMDACDQVLELMEGVENGVQQKVQAQIVRVFEACTFQDITGQRIKKVVGSLKQIDGKIKSVLTAIDGYLVDGEHIESANPEGEDSLLNGPALPANAVTQDDIDRMLSEFDATQND